MGTKSVLGPGSEEDGIGFMGFKNNNKTNYKFIFIFVSPSHRALEILTTLLKNSQTCPTIPVPSSSSWNTTDQGPSKIGLKSSYSQLY